MNRSALIPSLIIGVSIIIAAFLYSGGLYETRATGNPALFLWRVNKLTGVSYFCSGQGTDSDEGLIRGCVRMPEYTTQDEADAAIVAAYFRNHREEAAKRGITLSTPTAIPSSSGRR